MSNDGERPSNRGWFKKGRSGNPGGRPKSAQGNSGSAFDVIVDRTLRVSRGGVGHDVTVEEALQHRTYQEALAGKRMAIREVMRWIVKRERWLAENRPVRPVKTSFAGTIQDPDNADEALLLLGIARENPDRKDLIKDRLQLQLEPWAVKAALKRRRGARPLTTKEVDDVRRCSHDDGTLKLPRGVDV
jgi:hypothetical protein